MGKSTKYAIDYSSQRYQTSTTADQGKKRLAEDLGIVLRDKNTGAYNKAIKDDGKIRKR